MTPLSSCRGQAYDGASNMAGWKSGVATRIANEEPLAIHVHCLAHCVNLCIQDVISQCKPIKDALDLVFELVGLIKYSPKREQVFLLHQSQLSIDHDTVSLKPLCPTRWTCRTGSIAAVITNYELLIDVLEEISTTTDYEYGRKASGFHAFMEKFSTFFGLRLAHLIFSASEQLSITLQSKNVMVQEAMIAVNMAKQFYTRQRELSSFQPFFTSVVAESTGKTDPPLLLRYCRVPKRLDAGDENHMFQDPEEYYRQQYFQVMDSCYGELATRFEQKGFTVASHIETVIMNSCNGKPPAKIPDEVAVPYSKDLNIERLIVQLSMIPDLV